MPVEAALLRNLRTDLTSLIDGSGTQGQVNHLILLCHSFAFGYLGRQIANGGFSQSLLALPQDDIAYDCIADLFERNDDGDFIQIQAYFKGIAVETESDEALLIHLRRLTFSKTSHGLFRLYKEADPALGRVLRNIKASVATLNNFEQTERFGESFLTPTCCDALNHRPLMERMYFDDQFSRTAHGLTHIPALLGRLSLFLREQTEYRRTIGLMTTAIVFRNIFARRNVPLLEEPDIDATLRTEDARKLIREASTAVRTEMSHRYRKKAHRNHHPFPLYFEVIEEYLLRTLVDGENHDHSFFDSLRHLMPGLTKEEYHKQHRAVLEYGAKLTRERMLQYYRSG